MTVPRVCLSLLGLLLVCTCAGYPNTPQGVTEAYFQALSSGDCSLAAKYLLEQDARYMNEPEVDCKALEKIWKLSKWRILGAKISDNSALVKIHLESPNLGKLAGGGLADLIAGQLLGREMPDSTSDLLNELDEGNVELVETDSEIELDRQGGKWVISLNIEKTRATRKMLKEAVELKQHGDLSGARKKLEEVLAIDKNNTLANYLRERMDQPAGSGAPGTTAP